MSAKSHDQSSDDDAVRASACLLQPNIDQHTKLASYADPDETKQSAIRETMTRNQEALLTEAKQQPDLVVFPESSFTEPDFNYNAPIIRRISQMAIRSSAAMLVGGNRIAPGRTPEDYEVYNSAYLVHADGSWQDTAYDKMRLVPFGEDIPYLDIIPGLQSLTGIGSFNIGRQQTLFEVDGWRGYRSQIPSTIPSTNTLERVPLKFATLICFESTFAAMARSAARAGADFLVVQTNDGWYGRSAGAYQHHDLSQLRAIEMRRWVLRCANTGVSSIIAPSGTVVASLGLNQRGVLEQTIYLERNKPNTLFMSIGNSWLWAFVLFLGAVALWNRRDTAPQNQV